MGWLASLDFRKPHTSRILSHWIASRESPCLIPLNVKTEGTFVPPVPREECVCCFVLLNRYLGISVRSRGLVRVRERGGQPMKDSSNRQIWRLEKIGDSGTKPVILKFLSVHDLLPMFGRDNAVGRMIVWWTSPSLILHIYSLHQVVMATPSRVPLWRRGIIVTIFDDFGTNCMVHSYWDLAPRYVCGPSFIWLRVDLNPSKKKFTRF